MQKPEAFHAPDVVRSSLTSITEKSIWSIHDVSTKAIESFLVISANVHSRRKIDFESTSCTYIRNTVLTFARRVVSGSPSLAAWTNTRAYTQVRGLTRVHTVRNLLLLRPFYGHIYVSITASGHSNVSSAGRRSHRTQPMIAMLDARMRSWRSTLVTCARKPSPWSLNWSFIWVPILIMSWQWDAVSLLTTRTTILLHPVKGHDPILKKAKNLHWSLT